MTRSNGLCSIPGVERLNMDVTIWAVLRRAGTPTTWVTAFKMNLQAQNGVNEGLS